MEETLGGSGNVIDVLDSDEDSDIEVISCDVVKMPQVIDLCAKLEPEENWNIIDISDHCDNMDILTDCPITTNVTLAHTDLLLSSSCPQISDLALTSLKQTDSKSLAFTSDSSISNSVFTTSSTLFCHESQQSLFTSSVGDELVQPSSLFSDIKGQDLAAAVGSELDIIPSSDSLSTSNAVGKTRSRGHRKSLDSSLDYQQPLKQSRISYHPSFSTSDTLIDSGDFLWYGNETLDGADLFGAMTTKTELITCFSCKLCFSVEKISFCANRHGCCGLCLTEHVKIQLINSIKGAINCREINCSAYYLQSELKKTIPEMVVSVLEEKLNKEFQDRIENQISGRNLPGNESCEFPSEPQNVPSHWVPFDDEEKYKLVELPCESEEYSAVAKRFHKTMSKQRATIVRVKRIQNKDLWQFFILQRSQMQREKGKKPVCEELLFHGTQATVVDSISRFNFDWRVSGKHGTAYGDGSYFAKEASYSHMYTNMAHFLSDRRIGNHVESLYKLKPGQMPPSGNQVASNQAGGNQAAGNQAAGNQAAGNQAAGNQAAGNQAAASNQLMFYSPMLSSVPVTMSGGVLHGNGNLQIISGPGAPAGMPLGGPVYPSGGPPLMLSHSINSSTQMLTGQMNSTMTDRSMPYLGGQMGGPMQQMGGPMQQMGGPMQQMGGPMQQMGGPMHQLGCPNQQMGGPMQQMGGPMHQLGCPIQQMGGPVQPMGGPMQPMGGPMQQMSDQIQKFSSLMQQMGGPMQMMSGSLPMMGGPMQQMGGPMQQMGGPMQQMGGPMQQMGCPIQQMGGPVQPMGGPMQPMGGPMQQMSDQIQKFSSLMQQMGGPMQMMSGSLPMMGGPMQQMGGPMQQMGGPMQQMGGPMQQMGGPMQQMGGPNVGGPMCGPVPPMGGLLLPQSTSASSKQNKPASQTNDGTPVVHSMFLARVLVGDYALGKSSYRKPPPLNEKEPLGRCFDSCVNNLKNPTIYIIFNPAQCYPEYLIEYTNLPRNS